MKEFSFSNVEFEVICSYPSGDVCQTFQDAHRNIGVGGGWEKERTEEEQLGVFSITVVGESMRCDCRA